MATDDQIRNAVIGLFKKYDRDNSGYVEGNEIYQMFNDLGRELSFKKNYSNQDIDNILKSIDRNQDGRVTKDELFLAMKKINE